MTKPTSGEGGDAGQHGVAGAVAGKITRLLESPWPGHGDVVPPRRLIMLLRMVMRKPLPARRPGCPPA